MSKTTIIGDISITVGTYTLGDGTVKKRGRTIGTVFETIEEDGSRRLSLKVDAEVFQTSLFALAGPFRKKGEDSFWLNVFPPRDEKAKPPQQDAAQGEGEPF